MRRLNDFEGQFNTASQIAARATIFSTENEKENNDEEKKSKNK